MFGTHDLVLFMATALVVNATPGADMMFTLARTLQFGWRAGVAAALGIGAGCVVHTLAAAHRMRRLGARPAARRALNAVGATLFAALAARLVTARR